MPNCNSDFFSAVASCVSAIVALVSIFFANKIAHKSQSALIAQIVLPHFLKVVEAIEYIKTGSGMGQPNFQERQGSFEYLKSYFASDKEFCDAIDVVNIEPGEYRDNSSDVPDYHKKFEDSVTVIEEKKKVTTLLR